ncbi:hypothetical protein JKF63_07855 [Porcisia hertigi]|uniref:Uncharacterized protein n=1 Tax=Porcisia hertigi TaxID=2761500 RepID=A0A836LML6_9TRYP|nr:hypothetical protein JKF63_07855 [Porcisia hertigi]
MVTATRPARRATPAAEVPSLSHEARDQPTQQQQQQLSATSATAMSPAINHSSRHCDADVARVRAALAEAGYPNPSWGDIERVFEQFALNEDFGADNAAAEKPETLTALSKPHLSRRVVEEDKGGDGQWGEPHYHSDERPTIATPSPAPSPQQQQDGYPAESRSLLQYLEPTLRLQRYIQLRERELEELCLRPPFSSPPHASQKRLESYAVPSRYAPRASLIGQNYVTPHAARDSQMRAAMAARRRRAANIVYDATSDQRFRFFPTTRTPQGIGTLVTATPLHRTSSPSTSGRGALAGSAAATHLANYRNYYHCPRPNLCRTIGGQVSYLDPMGRTLPRKADPMKRGEQMRLLWAKDRFLSQRHRPREAWRTRQITMAYGHGADDGEVHDD